jgi:superfamily II DNA helicase RecQ
MKVRDVFLSIGTGGGKGLCYQVFPPVRLKWEQTNIIIVTPLISTLKEQTEQLNSPNLRSTYTYLQEKTK